VGSIMSRIVMMIIFYLVLTPVAFLFRLVGRDELKIKKPANVLGSYWSDHPAITDKSYYDHLF